ncbi:MAG: hypothetical protein H7Y08_03050, partial [Rhizobiaceae bacterium]|nr:hypothetical protein [Rhizobiaceae bacterium]
MEDGAAPWEGYSRSDPRPRFYDPGAPLDKALPEAIAATGLKRDVGGTDLRAASPSTVTRFDLPSRVLSALGLDPAEIAAARETAARQRTDIGRELVAVGVVTEEQLADAIAVVLGLARDPLLSEDRIMPRTGEEIRTPFPQRPGPVRLLKTCDGLLRTKLFLAPRLEDLGETKR